MSGREASAEGQPIRVIRSDIKNVQRNGSDKPTRGRDGYRLYPMNESVGQGFHIGDIVTRDGVVGFISNLDPDNEKRTTKPFVFTTLDPKGLSDGYFSHGQFCTLSELTLMLEDVVDDQEVADLFGIPVEDLP